QSSHVSTVNRPGRCCRRSPVRSRFRSRAEPHQGQSARRGSCTRVLPAGAGTAAPGAGTRGGAAGSGGAGRAGGTAGMGGTGGTGGTGGRTDMGGSRCGGRTAIHRKALRTGRLQGRQRRRGDVVAAGAGRGAAAGPGGRGEPRGGGARGVRGARAVGRTWAAPVAVGVRQSTAKHYVPDGSRGSNGAEVAWWRRDPAGGRAGTGSCSSRAGP